MRVLVTGATGLIGRALCLQLASEGHEITVLSRRPDAAHVVPSARTFGWNPEVESPPREAWQGVEAVIHLAGEPVAAIRWTDEHKKRIRDSRVKGTRHLVAGMKELSVPPKVFVSSSAVGFYGNRGQESLDETSSSGKGFLTEVCVEWEHEAASAGQLGIKTSLVRVGVVLSEHGGALEKMLPPFKLGLGARLGDGQQWFPWIHLDDIVGIFRHALLNQLSGPVNGVAPNGVTNEEFTNALAGALHRPTFLPVPEFALRLLMGEMANVVLVSQRVFPKVALDNGYRFKYADLTAALESFFKK
ncbi:MAG TPA: TIGR01777 family oxidoreductase [Blastocatellia bacterium]|nr:TIGR01777 family oxidoreductase [Blastocatellia bacterium]HMV86953.1 TIGR01777 family oxidoreductase [Blastocatellia bacterium]HMX28177.1 TIGR01777 family oxidoreductase [Blastocatellia bacterium]HMZ17045.1 TIGR01777 family oxidoreductase [Blastocatellia bacterium]HNG34326.1 TIGR01777 family oxidoreductase [Blastocatellia bacterium]